jgi:rubrerythrin
VDLTEQEKTISALQTSIKMEIDGKAFYLKASVQSTIDTGKKLLTQLAEEEDAHLQLFERIYEKIRKDKLWPDMEIRTPNRVKTIFTNEESKILMPRKTPSDEVEAVKIAIDMEAKSYEFYRQQLKFAIYPSEIRFYEALVAQEHGHQLVLLDYVEFLQDPVSYFQKFEHHSFDGA